MINHGSWRNNPQNEQIRQTIICSRKIESIGEISSNLNLESSKSGSATFWGWEKWLKLRKIPIFVSPFPCWLSSSDAESCFSGVSQFELFIRSLSWYQKNTGIRTYARLSQITGFCLIRKIKQETTTGSTFVVRFSFCQKLTLLSKIRQLRIE